MAERPTVLTERLVLRPFTTSDAVEMARMCGEPEMSAKTTFIPHPYEAADAMAWIWRHQATFEMGKEINWAIERREDGALVGGIGLTLVLAHSKAGLWMLAGREYWGRGYSSEASAAVVRYGFETMGLHRIEGHVMVRNPAAGRVFEKAGFVREGVFRGVVKKDGEFWDVELWARLLSDRGKGARRSLGAVADDSG